MKIISVLLAVCNLVPDTSWLGHRQIKVFSPPIPLRNCNRHTTGLQLKPFKGPRNILVATASIYSTMWKTGQLNYVCRHCNNWTSVEKRPPELVSMVWLKGSIRLEVHVCGLPRRRMSFTGSTYTRYSKISHGNDNNHGEKNRH